MVFNIKYNSLLNYLEELFLIFYRKILYFIKNMYIFLGYWDIRIWVIFE